MKLYLGTYLSVPLYLHWSWFLLLILVAINPSVAPMLIGLFVCVILHEYGHCAAAVYHGIQPKDVTIHFLGGTARMPGPMWQSPRKELWITLAGPGVNFALCILSFVVGLFLPTAALTAVATFIFWNLLIGVFNLLPVFPMDGGRIMRSLMHMVTGDIGQATQFTVRFGQGLGVVLGIVSLFYGLFGIAFVFAFMMLAAEVELAYVRQWLRLHSIKKRLAEHLNLPEMHDASLDAAAATLRTASPPPEQTWLWTNEELKEIAMLFDEYAKEPGTVNASESAAKLEEKEKTWPSE